MPALREMFDLQTVDQEIDRRRQRLVEIAERLGNDRPLAKLRAEATTLRESVRKLSARQAELDGVAGEFTGRIEAAETKLYGGTVTSSRELTDLQADIAQLKRQRGDREGELLEVMDELDTERGRLDEVTKQLAEAESAWNEDQQQMAKEKSVIETELAKLTEDRKARAGAIPPGELALYEQVRKGHSGKAVAQIRNGICQSCRVALPTRQVTLLKTAATPGRCPSCGLILLPE